MPNHIAYGSNPYFFLGKNWDGNGSGSRELNGSLFAVNIFNTALSSNEIASLYSTLASPSQGPVLLLKNGGSGVFQFSFTGTPGAAFEVLATTNLAAPLNQWVVVGTPPENPAGTFQFSTAIGATNRTLFYRVRSP